MGVGLAVGFWKPHLEDEEQLHSFDAAHESAHRGGSEGPCVTCVEVAAGIFH